MDYSESGPKAIPDDSIKSYEWWREHGSGWPAEVAERRAKQIIYTLQECFLQTYFCSLAPANILEFGCGFGRHLRYLEAIPGLNCWGCDQSASMLDGINQWAAPEWIQARIRRIEPLEPLPYPTEGFDVVFTTSVLIHVAPAHLISVLRELVRVARYEIIHIENNQVERTAISSVEHDGCWMHPLLAAYGAIGVRAEVLPKGMGQQDIYRVRLNPMNRSTVSAERLLLKLAELDRLWRMR